MSSNIIDLNDYENKTIFAYDSLYEMIIKGELPEQSVLVERNITQMLGISRTPVREALNMLWLEGLVEKYPGKGMIVSKNYVEDYIAVFELRKAVDVLALRLFMKTGKKKIIDLMRQSVTEMRICLDKEDYASFIECDIAFHKYYFFNTGNRYLEKMIRTIAGKMRQMMNPVMGNRERCEEVYLAHKSIIDSIDTGDNNKATELLEKHISDSLQWHLNELVRFDLSV